MKLETLKTEKSERNNVVKESKGILKIRDWKVFADDHGIEEIMVLSDIQNDPEKSNCDFSVLI